MDTNRLVPVSDILDLLQMMDYNEEATINSFLLHIEQDLKCENKPTANLKALHYFMIHKKNSANSNDLFEKILKSCLTFIQATSDKDVLFNNIIGSIIDTCLSRDDSNFLNQACNLLASCIDVEFQSYLNSEFSKTDRSLMKLFLILEKLCNLNISISSSSINVKFEGISKYITEEITNLMHQLPVESSQKRLVTMLPKFIKAKNSEAYLKLLWTNIEQLDCDEEQLDKQLFFLCLLSDNFITLSSSSLSYPLYRKSNFWEILQNGLISANSINRKFSLHLLRQYVIKIYDSNVDFDGEYFFWKHELKTNLTTFWDQIFIIFETLEEKQVHLITPALKSLPDLFSNSQINLKNYYSWLLCIFDRIICHSSNTLVKWGLQEFCLLNTSVLFADKKCSILLSSFFKSMNNMFLYNLNPEEDDNLQNYLVKWFVSVSECDCYESAFEVLLDKLVNSPWSPIPLYFITDSLSRVPKKFILDEKCLNLIRKVVSETLKTQCVFIRSAIQCRLLKCITQLSKEHIDLITVINILGNFNGNESLLRGTGIWNTCVEWLKLMYQSQNNIKLIDLCCNKIFNNEYPLVSIHACARSFVIFIDSDILQFDYMFSTFLNRIFEQFENCEKRMYACSEIQDKCLEFIKYIINECNLFDQKSASNKLIEWIKPNINLLLDYIEFRLKKGNIDSFESVELYASTIKTIVFYTFFTKEIELLPLYAISFSVIKADMDGQSLFTECLSLKIIYRIYKYLSIHTFNRHKCFEPYEQYLVNEIFKKRLFHKDSISINSVTPDENHKGKVISNIKKNIWSIFYNYLLNNAHYIILTIDLFNITIITDCSLKAICEDGKQALVPILQSFSILLPHIEDINSSLEFISKSWVACFELRKSDLFWLTIYEWITMVYQENIINRKEYHKLIYKYSKEIVDHGDELFGLVDILTDRLSHLPCIPLELSFLITDGLTFGSIARKDRRTEFEVCQYIIRQSEEGSIESFGKWKPIRNDKEVRIRSLKILLTMKNVEDRNELIISVFNDLIEYDTSLTKNNKRYFNDSIIHRKKHRILQALLILEDYIFNSLSSLLTDLPEKLFNWVFQSLQGLNQQPSVRYQLEWLFVRLCIHYPVYLRNFWLYFEQAGIERMGSICSFISISYHLAIILKDNTFLKRCFENIIPWCMSQNFNIRLYSQVVLSKLWDLSPQVSQQFDFIQKNQQKIYYEQGNVLVNAKKMQSDFYFSCFHPLHHFSLETIYWDLPRLSNISAEEWTNHEILKKYSRLLDGCSKSQMVCSLENCLTPTWISKVTGDAESNFESTSIQKKFIPWKGLLTEPEEITKQAKYGIILVASLIDKAANLGGLARTSEIFAAKELVIPNLEIIKDKEFLGLSMTAEKHLPVTEVKPYNLQEYLNLMKSHGYTLVGLEQTTESVSLATYKFPKNCILLLGNEREGIPANLIPLMDYCVEIPQLGVIRSLNVHVSGALFLWEYSKQYSLKQS